MKRVGIVGFGVAGSWIAQRLLAMRAGRHQLSALCLRDRQICSARRLLPGSVRLCSDVDELLQTPLDLVIEAAGQAFVKACGVKIVASGRDLHLLSAGALADEAIRADLRNTAMRTGARIRIPAGALAGFRGLMTLREAGLRSVRYISTKPSRAWVGTPAAAAFPLNELTEPTVIFEGNAADAAQLYPANANLAAAVAIAGLGFQRTKVTLIADPRTKLNIGRVEAVSRFAKMSVTMAGKPFIQNPKTSRIAALSIIAALRSDDDAIGFS